MRGTQRIGWMLKTTHSTLQTFAIGAQALEGAWHA